MMEQRNERGYFSSGSSPSTEYQSCCSIPSPGYQSYGSTPFSGYQCSGSAPSTGYQSYGSSPSPGYQSSGSIPSTGYQSNGSSPSPGYQCNGSSSFSGYQSSGSIRSSGHEGSVSESPVDLEFIRSNPPPQMRILKRGEIATSAPGSSETQPWSNAGNQPCSTICYQEKNSFSNYENLKMSINQYCCNTEFYTTEMIEILVLALACDAVRPIYA